MSSFLIPRVRTGSFGVMVLTGLITLSIGHGMARCDLVPTANGANQFVATNALLTTPVDITVAGVNGSSGLYDTNSVLYLTNGNALAQTITAQYMVNGVAVGPMFSTTLGAGTTSTVALPQQLTLQPSTSQVTLHVVNMTGGPSVLVNAGSAVNVTGYSSNGGGTANGPGSTILAAPLVIPPTNSITTASVGVLASQGLIGVNSALFINNTVGTAQTVTARYTVDGTAQPTSFTVTLPASGTTSISLPTQLTVAPGVAHTIGLQITDNNAAGISVLPGSRINATSYNTIAGIPSVSGATVANQTIPGFGAIPATIALGLFGTADVMSLVVPAAQNPTFSDVNASLNLLNNSTAATTITAQYTVNGTLTGQLFTITLPGNVGPVNGVGSFSMPTQFLSSSLAAGSTLGIELATPGGGNFTIESDVLTITSHNQTPTVGTPEPASLSLAAMAAMAFGAAAYRKRKSAVVRA